MKAEGEKQAAILTAEGVQQRQVLEAEGQAQAVQDARRGRAVPRGDHRQPARPTPTRGDLPGDPRRRPDQRPDRDQVPRDPPGRRRRPGDEDLPAARHRRRCTARSPGSPSCSRAPATTRPTRDRPRRRAPRRRPAHATRPAGDPVDVPDPRPTSPDRCAQAAERQRRVQPGWTRTPSGPRRCGGGTARAPDAVRSADPRRAGTELGTRRVGSSSSSTTDQPHSSARRSAALVGTRGDQRRHPRSSTTEPRGRYR